MKNSSADFIITIYYASWQYKFKKKTYIHITTAAVSAAYSALLSSSYFERINDDDDDDDEMTTKSKYSHTHAITQK